MEVACHMNTPGPAACMAAQLPQAAPSQCHVLAAALCHGDRVCGVSLTRRGREPGLTGWQGLKAIEGWCLWESQIRRGKHISSSTPTLWSVWLRKGRKTRVPHPWQRVSFSTSQHCQLLEAACMGTVRAGWKCRRDNMLGALLLEGHRGEGKEASIGWTHMEEEHSCVPFTSYSFKNPCFCFCGCISIFRLLFSLQNFLCFMHKHRP